MKRREDRLFAWVGAQPDAREGVQAFLDKREPAHSNRFRAGLRVDFAHVRS